jgi:hypothetical protein
MTELTANEIKIGKKQIKGPLILCWVLAILLGIGLLSGFASGPVGYISNYTVDYISNYPASYISNYLDAYILNYPDTHFIWSIVADLARPFIGFPFRIIYSLLAPALYIVELVGLYQRKAFAVPLGRAVLVVTMVLFFPIGTIFGGIMWKRFKNPMTKKYLNYEDEYTMEAEEKAGEKNK